MYPASDPISLYVASLGSQLRLDPWTRRRVLAEIEDHLREAEDEGGSSSPQTFFGDHRQLANELMLVWLERRCLSLRLLLVIAAVVTGLAMYAIKTLTAGSLDEASLGAATLVHLLNRGAGLIALMTIGAALLAVRHRKFDLSRVGVFTRLAGVATLFLGASVAGEIVTILLGLPSTAARALLPIEALLLAETVAVTMTLGMWKLTHRILAGLR